jgi:signal transduction histidine kinase
LQLRSDTATEATALLKVAEEAASRAETLTQRLLAFARQQELIAAPTDVTKLVSELAPIIRHTVGSTTRLEFVLTEDLARTTIDAFQLETALLNLCSNAKDAMPDGGILRIETSEVDVDVEEAEGQGVKPGGFVRLTITDNGVGMSPEVAAQAFEPFYTTKDIGDGTGLGLSMLYGFVRQSGGYTTLKTARGVGTTVSMLFPKGDRIVNPDVPE